MLSAVLKYRSIMINKENFGKSLQIENPRSLLDWPFLLVKTLPQLLELLLHPATGPSLERLQLVSAVINVIDPNMKLANGRWGNAAVFLAEGNQFLELKGELMGGNEQTLLSLAVKYFIRGQAKYFPWPDQRDFSAKINLKPIYLQDVELFLRECGQYNESLLNQDLASLNGHSIPIIPSQMSLALLVCHSLCVLDALEKSPSCFHLSFGPALKQGQAVVFSHGILQGDFVSAINTDEHTVVALRTSVYFLGPGHLKQNPI